MGTLNKKTVGAWLLHHDQKLANARTTEFESIVAAGRSARLLSAISREHQTTVSRERVVVLAQQTGIREIEAHGYLSQLERHGLIDVSESAVTVLGVSQAGLLGHAADLFEDQSPLGVDRAVVDLAERSSQAPLRRDDCAEELADNYRLSTVEVDDVFRQSESIGFVDYENDGASRIYFNGSLFRRGDAAKAKLVLDNLSHDEAARLVEAEERLKAAGCVLANELHKILGLNLWRKLHQIGFFDVSEVFNEKGATKFVTKPEALAKYVPAALADMLDDAKALASSLTYGIVNSPHARGRIRDPAALIGALLNRGYVEGWARAIKKDYRALERRGVVQVTTTSAGNRLSLLKPEVGRMAQDLILNGNAATTAAEIIVADGVASFRGPEAARVTERKRAVPESKAGVMRTLNVLRK